MHCVYWFFIAPIFYTVTLLVWLLNVPIFFFSLFFLYLWGVASILLQVQRVS